MKTTIKTINAAGLLEIRDFLGEFHKLGGDHFTDSMIRAWAADAQFQLAEGNPAAIEIRSYDSTTGATVSGEIRDAGIDCAEVEIDE